MLTDLFTGLQRSKGHCYESYSEHPEIVRNMTEIIVGVQGDIPANSLCCWKLESKIFVCS